MLEDYNDILSVEETCEVLGIGRNNLYKLLNCRQLKAFRNGKVWRIPKQAIIEYICKNSNIT